MEEELRLRAQASCCRYYQAFGKTATQRLVFEEYASPELYAIPLDVVPDFIADVDQRVEAGTP